MEKLVEAMVRMANTKHQAVQQQRERAERCQEQMERMLQDLNGRPQQREREWEVTMTDYQDEEDIVSFLESFEGIMRLNRVRGRDWVRQLTWSLTGKAREVGLQIAYEDCSYGKLKDGLLKYFDVTPESQRCQFRQCTWTRDVKPEQFIRQKEQMMQWWLGNGDDLQSVLDRILMEQVIGELPATMQTWVGERDPKNKEKLAKCMSTYITYHLQEPRDQKCPSFQPVEGRVKSNPSQSNNERRPSDLGTPKKPSTDKRVSYKPKSELTCYKCRQKGHIARECKNSSSMYQADAVEANERVERIDGGVPV